MTIEVELPDGRVVEFPAGTPKDTMEKALSGMKGATSVLGDAGVTAGSVGAQFNEGLAQAADMVPQMGRWIRRQFDSSIPPLQAKDPAGVRTALKSVGIPVGDLETQKREYGVQEGPIRRIGGTAAKIAGQSVPFLPIGPAGQALKATAGAAIGGAAGSEIGGETGELIGAVAGGLRGGRLPAPKVPAAMGTGELKDAAKAAYKSADDAGVVVSQGSFARFVNDLEPTLAARNFDKEIHPTAFRTFQKLASEAEKGNITLSQVFKIRELMNDWKAAAPKAKDAAMIKTMRDKLDDYVAGMTELKDIVPTVGSNLRQGIEKAAEGRALWRRHMGLKTIEKLVENAKTNAPTYTAAGYDTALRNQFKALVKNEKQMRFFTPAEREALTRVARGGPVANTMRQLSRLAPQNILYTLLAANIHPAMVAGGAAGAGARAAASGLTKRNVKFASDLVARGYSIPGPGLTRYRSGVPVAASAILSRTGQE